MRRIFATLAGVTLAAGVAVGPAQAVEDLSVSSATASSTVVASSNSGDTPANQTVQSKRQVTEFNAPTIGIALLGLAVVAGVTTNSVRAATREENQNR